MKTRLLLLLFPTAMLIACGGNEETSNNNNSDADQESEEVTFGSSYETCASTGTTIKMSADPIPEDYSSAMSGLEGVDLGTFNTSSAELTKKHNTLYIKWVNNPSIIDSNIPSYGAGDMSMTIMIKAEDGELAAGEYTGEDLKIKLTRGMREGNTSKSKDIGSNKTKRSIVLNEISEKHVCGSYLLETEDGLPLVQASFDLDVEVVRF